MAAALLVAPPRLLVLKRAPLRQLASRAGRAALDLRLRHLSARRDLANAFDQDAASAARLRLISQNEVGAIDRDAFGGALAVALPIGEPETA